MFQDEARFGRINEPQAMLVAEKDAAHGRQQIIREYTYAYGAVSLATAPPTS